MKDRIRALLSKIDRSECMYHVGKHVVRLTPEDALTMLSNGEFESLQDAARSQGMKLDIEFDRRERPFLTVKKRALRVL